jgi:hypothetical protein
MQLTPVRAQADRAVPLAFLIGESVASLLDLNAEGAQIEALHLTLAPTDNGGFVLELDAQAAPGKRFVPSPISQRLVGAFARQIGAELKQDVARPYFVRIESAAA